LDAEYS